MSGQGFSFSGQCPACQSYNTRIRTDVTNYASDTPPLNGPEDRVANADSRVQCMRAHLVGDGLKNTEARGCAVLLNICGKTEWKISS